MPPFVASSTARARSLLGQFTLGQKAVVGLAVVALIVGGLFFTRWASKPSYAPLYTNLAAADAAAITDKLAADKTPYELADGGSTILVPRKDVYQLRLTMSGAGLPEGEDGGYSLLDKHGITTSEFQQRVDYQRAMEGELAKTVRAIDGVDTSVVHLVIPEQDVFADDARKPSASVLVKTKPGKDLTPTQVQAVVHLVSSSIEGLTPDNVTVADAKGRVLSAPGENGLVAAGGEARTQQVQSYEADLAASAQRMLDKVVGAGRAVVTVNADLDFDQSSTTTERFVNERGAPPLTENTTTETYQGAGSPVGGVLGPDNQAGATTTTGGQSRYSKTQQQKTNSVGKVTEQRKAAPGSVKRLSVAVVLDANKDKVVDSTQVQQLVAAAVGLDPKRGDTIAVSQLSFDDTAARAAAKELAEARKAEQRTALLSIIKTAAVLLVVGLLLLFALRASRRTRRTPVAVDLQRYEIEAAVGLRPPARCPRRSRRSSRTRSARNSSRRRPTRRRQPDEVAQLLRGWLANRRS